MPKEVLLYGSINAWSIRDFIESINDSGSDNLIVRVNTNGGDVMYGWGGITKLSEIPNVQLINDGEANSMGALFFLYGKNNVAADYSTFGFHRAGYPDWLEKDPKFFTDEVKANINRVNGSIRKAFEAKIDPDKWKAETKVSVDELFSLDGRKEVTVNAKMAMRLGLINEIVRVTPKRISEIEAKTASIEAKYNTYQIAAKQETTEKMDIETLKAEHSGLYNKIFNLGQEAGINAERDRIGSIMAYYDADPKGCKELITSGKSLNETQRSELSLKVVAKLAGAAIEDGNNPGVDTPDAEDPKFQTPEGKKTQADEKKLAEDRKNFKTEVFGKLGIKS